MKIQKWQGGKKNFWVKLAHQLQTAPSNGETTLANTNAIRNVVIEKAREDAVAKGEDPNRAEEDIMRRTGTVAAAFPLALGIAGTGTAVAANPALYGKAAFETATSMAGGAGVDAASEAMTGKSVGENVAHYTGADKAYQNNALARFGFDMLNPGYVLGGGAGKAILGRIYPTVFNPNVGRFVGTPSKESYSSPTATIRNNAPEPTRPISEAERLGIPKGERTNLTSDQLEALEDVMSFNSSGKYKNNLYIDPTGKIYWSKRRASAKPFIQEAAEDGLGDGAYGLNGVRFRGYSPYYDGTVSVGYDNGPQMTSFNLHLPIDYGSATFNSTPEKTGTLILTPPRVDFYDPRGYGIDNLSLEAGKSLPNTISKELMSKYWKAAEDLIRPGTYISGDTGTYPLGLEGIRAIRDNKGITSAFSKILYPQKTSPHGPGLSVDSFSSIVRQGQRPGKSLRWGSGFTQWNDSGVENKMIYDAWKRMNAGEITPEQYKEIFDSWSLSIGGRPAKIYTIPKFRTIRNNDGTISKIEQEQKKYVIMPHPYIYYKQHGGILKAQNGVLLFSKLLPKIGATLIAKRSNQAQVKSLPTIAKDIISGKDKSFYSYDTVDGGNEIDTYIWGKPYSTEFTGDKNVGPDYTGYIEKNYPDKKDQIKTYNTHFGDTLYIDNSGKPLVESLVNTGKTAGASMGRFAHAPSYIITTKEGRPYDAGGHLMTFSKDKNGNIVANMSDIFDFNSTDFNDKYNHTETPSWASKAMDQVGTPFIVRQNNVPVVFKKIIPEYKTELQKELGDFLSQWGDYYDLSIPLRMTDDQIKEVLYDTQYGEEILNNLKNKGWLRDGGVLKAQKGQTTPEPNNFMDRILKPIKYFAEQRRIEKPKDTLNTQPQISETPKFPNNQRVRFGAPPGPHFTALMGHKPHSIEDGGKI